MRSLICWMTYVMQAPENTGLCRGVTGDKDGRVGRGYLTKRPGVSVSTISVQYTVIQLNSADLLNTLLLYKNMLQEI